MKYLSLIFILFTACVSESEEYGYWWEDLSIKVFPAPVEVGSACQDKFWSKTSTQWWWLEPTESGIILHRKGLPNLNQMGDNYSDFMVFPDEDGQFLIRLDDVMRLSIRYRSFVPDCPEIYYNIISVRREEGSHAD